MKLTHSNHLNHKFFNGFGSANRLTNKAASYAYLLLIFLLADGFLVFAGWLHPSQYFSDKSFAITQEWGYGEMFQYFKELSIALVLFALFKKTQNRMFKFWGVFFSYLLFDDAFELHETLGNVVASNFFSNDSYIFNLRGQDIGEFIICALIGSVFYCFSSSFFIAIDKPIK